MWKEGIEDLCENPQKLERIVNEIKELEALGCDIIRFAVPDMDSAHALNLLSEKTQMPLVADIHFDYRLALECCKSNVAAIRINPGNIGSREKVEAVAGECKKNNIAIRIGVNSGSIPRDLDEMVIQNKISRAKALSLAALREVKIFEELGFNNVVVSMKASSVQETIDANKEFSNLSDIPLHIGVTEAGPLITGVVKSSIAFYELLKQNIGSTIRVSLSDSPENEVKAGRYILQECGKKPNGITLVSCPRCGRVGFDVHSFVSRWENKLLALDSNITVAIMGCIVNGPGEGRHADLGIAGGKDKVIIFRKGEIIKTVKSSEADKEFEEQLNLILNDRKSNDK